MTASSSLRLARALCRQQRIATGDEALVRVVGVGELSQVSFVEERQMQSRSPVERSGARADGSATRVWCPRAGP